MEALLINIQIARNAILNVQLETFRGMLKQIDINAAYEDTGAALLHLCVVESQLPFLKDLIDAGADVNVQRKDGVTPLWLAVCCEELACVQCLIAAGANVNLSNQLGVTPLHLAVKQQHLPLFKILLAAAADPYQKAANAQSVIDICKQLHLQVYLDCL